MIRTLFAIPIALMFIFAACGGDDDGGPATDYPDAGEDRFENTRATVQIEITQPTASLSPLSGQRLETIQLEGPALIMRGDPQQDGDLFFVPTEIVEMELTGTSSFGPVIVRESADRQSTGEVRQQQADEDFPAASFFDVFVEVELPDLDLTLHNEEPMRMESTLSSLPPAEGDEYRGEDDRPLYTPAGLAVGRIVDALHIPEPEGEEPEPAATATTAASPTSAPAAEATATPSATAPTTEGGCTHGTGQSVLHIVFRGLQPGQTLSGNVVQGPPDGLIGDSQFEVTADDNGVARVDKDIARFGTYAWVADGAINGNYTVGQTCPGEP
ncbi:MAG: DUF6073 family protein [Dehalococcoidia bacterium]